jgi:hypothetical protein
VTEPPTPPRPLSGPLPPAPREYQGYWFFTNLQLGIDRALLALAAGAPAPPRVAVRVKPFPWPPRSEDLGAASAAAALNLLLVYAFLAPARGVVVDVVREKELRLREGMRMLGLTVRPDGGWGAGWVLRGRWGFGLAIGGPSAVSAGGATSREPGTARPPHVLPARHPTHRPPQEAAYWSSWALTHWAALAVSGALCTLAGLYPFAHSAPGLMLAFYWLFAAALVAAGYAVSTLFSTSRVAGTACQLVYALSMIPG